MNSSPVACPGSRTLQERLRLAEQRAGEIQVRLEALEQERLTEEEVAAALASFESPCGMP